MTSKVILITGLPCSGKTTLARQVSAALSCPMLSKDDYKERLADDERQTVERTTGAALASDSEARSELHTNILNSRSLGIRAEELMLAASLDLARADTTHVAESVLRPEYISAYLQEVSAMASVLVVALQCGRELLLQRFRQRSRHAIHNDAEFVGSMPTIQEIDVTAFRNYAVEVMEFETSELSEARLKELTATITGSSVSDWS